MNTHGSLYASPDSPIASAKKPKSLAKRLDDSSLNSPMKVVRKASSLTSPNAKPTPEPAKTGILNTFRNALFSPVIKADEEDGVGVVHASKHSYASGTNHANSSRSSSGSGSRGSPNPSSQPSASTTPRNGSVGSASVCFPSITRPSGPTVSIPNPYGGKPPASPSPKSPSIVRKNVNQVQQQVQSPPRVVQRVTPPPVQQISVDDDDEEDVFNPYQFIYMLPPHAYVKIPNKICLPPKQEPKHKFSLVLDLDETLVHCSVEPIPKPDIIFPVLFNNVTYQVYVRKRPHLETFLKAIANVYEVILFTASQKVYADKLLNYIDPEKKYVRHQLFRESCLNVQGNYIKDLDVLDRDLKTTVLVDNSPYAYSYHVNNGIPIESWYDDEQDEELLKLLNFLKQKIDNCNDVRPVIKEHFKTYKLVEDARRGVPLKKMVISGF